MDVPNQKRVPQVPTLEEDLLNLARLALGGSRPESTPLIRGIARRQKASHPALAAGLVDLLRDDITRSQLPGATVRSHPVDKESRLPLVKLEYPVVLPNQPILTDSLMRVLSQLIQEHKSPELLFQAGLAPTRTALFTGPPGVGKTMAARWLAQQLGRPLLTLDLASVMSSLLGRTGGNVRQVLEYAKQEPCVLLLDELDAVAKRRDDNTEIGELKRLVTVLLQEIDGWPEGGLLVAATNHSELLDPAVWRRFELSVTFPLPERALLERAIIDYLEGHNLPRSMTSVFAAAYEGSSYSDLERDVVASRRSAAMNGTAIDESLADAVRQQFRALTPSERARRAIQLASTAGLSQRATSELTGVSRDTLRQHSRRTKGQREGGDDG